MGLPCHQLDAYCDNQLSSSERLAFEQHLLQCSECRDQWIAHRELEPLLRSALEEMSGGKHSLDTRHVTSAYHIARRNSTWHSIGRAVAAMLLVAVAIASFRYRSDIPARSSPPPSLADQHKPGSMIPVDPAIAQFPAESELLPVQLRTHNPDVTVIWFYPTANDAEL